MTFLQKAAEWVNANPGKTVGASSGFILGILILTVGFWKTLIVLILILVGFVIGKLKDDNVPIADQIAGLFKKKE
ncbi:MAG: DUF2273 domain-containing protein [Spirochaetota bacterium]